MIRTGPSRHSSNRHLFETPQTGELTQLGCPDCRGVLAVREIGDKGYLSFSCQVGHTFSEESLLERKEVELEDSLWIATETVEELKRLLRVQVERGGTGAVPPSIIEQKLSAAEACATELRALLQKGLIDPGASE